MNSKFLMILKMFVFQRIFHFFQKQMPLNFQKCLDLSLLIVLMCLRCLSTRVASQSRSTAGGPMFDPSHVRTFFSNFHCLYHSHTILAFFTRVPRRDILCQMSYMISPKIIGIQRWYT